MIKIKEKTAVAKYLNPRDKITFVKSPEEGMKILMNFGLLRRYNWDSSRYIFYRNKKILFQDMRQYCLDVNDLTNFYEVKQDEKNWIGKLCFFSDFTGCQPTVGLLKAIDDKNRMKYKTDMGSYFNCRPLTEDEIKQITYKE